MIIVANGEDVVKRRKKYSRANGNQEADVDALADAIYRANRGDKTGLVAVRKLLSSDTEWAIEYLGGNLAREAETKLVEMTSGQDLAFREALLAKLNVLRTELAGPTPNSIERLLIERVVACWLQVYTADAIFAQAGKATFVEGDYLQRRQERAHRRYLSAIKMLALVRRMALPIRVDVNVAGRVETKPVEPSTPSPPRWRPECSVN